VDEGFLIWCFEEIDIVEVFGGGTCGYVKVGKVNFIDDSVFDECFLI